MLGSYSAFAESIRTFASSMIDFLPVIFAVVGIILVILLVLMSDRLVRKPLEKSAKKLIGNDDASSVRLPDDITACQVYRMLEPVSRVKPKSSSKKVPVLFAMAVLECIEKGYIISDKNEFIVGTPRDNAPAYILSVLNFLKTFCEKKGNTYILNKHFAENVKTECATRYDVVANYLATFSGLIPETGFGFFGKQVNKEIYENAYIVKLNALKVKHKPSFGQNVTNVLSGRKTTNAEVFSMLFVSSVDKIFVSDGKEGTDALCEALKAMYGIFIKSK